MSVLAPTNRNARRRSVESPSAITATVRQDPATAEPTVSRPATLLRLPIVRQRTGLSRSTIWRLERRGQFPRHVRVSTNIVAWHECDITAWILSRPDASRTATSAAPGDDADARSTTDPASTLGRLKSKPPLRARLGPR